MFSEKINKYLKNKSSLYFLFKKKGYRVKYNICEKLNLFYENVAKNNVKFT